MACFILHTDEIPLPLLHCGVMGLGRVGIAVYAVMKRLQPDGTEWGIQGEEEEESLRSTLVEQTHFISQWLYSSNGGGNLTWTKL